MESVLIGLDLGTTVCKCIVFDEKFKILFAVEKEYPLITISSGEIEQDANLWWKVTKNVIKESIKKSGIKPSAVKGISVSTQGISFVPVDEKGQPLRNAFSWLDTRAEKQRNQLLKAFDEKTIFSITGKRTESAYVLPKLLWMKENEPHIYDKTHKILMALDFIIMNMCGVFTTDHTMASGTLFYDITEQNWSSRILDRFNLDRKKLPVIQWSGSPIGVLKKRVARELNLTEEVVVSVGGQDQKVAALGAGIDTNLTTVSLGTAMAITQKCDYPVIDALMRIPCFTDLLRNKWVIEGSGIGTSSLDWLKNTLFPGHSYDDLNAMVKREDCKRNDVFHYPFFYGGGSPHWASDIRASFYGLDFSTNAYQIVKSVFEGIAYQIRQNIDVMEEIYKPVEEIRVFGGGSKSYIWCQIIADITNKKVVILYTSETGCIGAAILAGLGAKLFDNPRDAFTHIKVKNVFLPREDQVHYYKEQYQNYIAIQTKMMN